MLKNKLTLLTAISFCLVLYSTSGWSVPIPVFEDTKWATLKTSAECAINPGAAYCDCSENGDCIDFACDFRDASFPEFGKMCLPLCTTYCPADIYGKLYDDDTPKCLQSDQWGADATFLCKMVTDLCPDIDGIQSITDDLNDNDGVGNQCDNCPDDANNNQSDSDSDGIGDACDNCPTTSNPDQNDSDNDKTGDVCETVYYFINPWFNVCAGEDFDGDGLTGICDNCPTKENSNQNDNDKDLVGDECDNCPNDANASQADADGDGAGNVCDVDECSTTESPPLKEVEKCNGYASACETSVPHCEEVNDTYVWNCKHKIIEDCCALAGTNPPPPQTIQACEAEKGENCFHVICSDVTQQWECTPIPGANCDECQPGAGVPAEKKAVCDAKTTPGQCEAYAPICEKDWETGLFKWDCEESVIENCCSFDDGIVPADLDQACRNKEGPCYEVSCDVDTQQWSCGKKAVCEEPTEDVCMIGSHEYLIDASAPLAKAEEVCGKDAIDCRQPTAICRTGGTWMCTGAVTVPGCEEPTIERDCATGEVPTPEDIASVCGPQDDPCKKYTVDCRTGHWTCLGFEVVPGCEACTEGDKLNWCGDPFPESDFKFDDPITPAWKAKLTELLQGLEGASIDPMIYELIKSGDIQNLASEACISCEQVCNKKGAWTMSFNFHEEDEKCAPPKEELCKPIIHPEWFNVDKKADLDGDGVPNMCDNCVNISNPGQLDDNHDNVGNACDDDEKCMSPCCGASCCCSGPGCPATVAECPLAVGAEIGHPVMDPDGDTRRNDLKDKSSGLPCDNCPTTANPYQEDWDRDTVGNACDNCTLVPNLTQKEAFDGACKDADFASNDVACGASCPAAKEVTPPTIADESKEEIPAENAEECKAAGGEWLSFVDGDLVTESDIAVMIARGESVKWKCLAAAEFKGACACSFTEHSTWNMAAIYRLLLISLFFAVPYFWFRRRLATS